MLHLQIAPSYCTFILHLRIAPSDCTFKIHLHIAPSYFTFVMHLHIDIAPPSHIVRCLVPICRPIDRSDATDEIVAYVEWSVVVPSHLFLTFFPSTCKTYSPKGVCGELSWVAFLAVCFLYKMNPNPRKNTCFGTKWPPLTYSFLDWVGPGLGSSSVS